MVSGTSAVAVRRWLTKCAVPVLADPRPRARLSGVRSGDRVQMHRYIAMLLLFLAKILFWGMFEQAGSSMNFFGSSAFNAALSPISERKSRPQAATIFFATP